VARPLTGRGTKGTSRSLTRGFGAGRGTIPGVSRRAVVGSALAALIAADLLASRVAPGPDVAVGLGLVAVLGLVARVAGLSPADLGLARSSWRAGLRGGQRPQPFRWRRSRSRWPSRRCAMPGPTSVHRPGPRR